MRACLERGMRRRQPASLYLPEGEMKLQEEKKPGRAGQIDGGDAKVRALETELKRAKDSERNMLESLVSQTKQLEKAKMELEEAKLQLRLLHDASPPGGKSGSLLKRMERSNSLLDLARAQQEILTLRNELRLATEAEAKSNTAMDDLAVALKEVATEANRAKDVLAATQAQFQAARAEADRNMGMLNLSDEALERALRENARLRSEAEDLAASWQAKEEGFRSCMKMFEEDMGRTKVENDRLRDLQRGTREEISKLRDIMKHAVNEANVLQEALEIARTENSQLKDTLAEKERSLQQLKQELDSLKVSEAAAVDSVEELKTLLAATSDLGEPNASAISLVDLPRVLVSSPLHPPASADESSPVLQHRKHRRFSSTGSASVAGAPSSRTRQSDDYDGGGELDFRSSSHVDGTHSAWGSPSFLYKKKPMLRKFGDMLRRSFHK